MDKAKKIIKNKKVQKVVVVSAITGVIFIITGIYLSPYVWGINGVKAIIKAIAR